MSCHQNPGRGDNSDEGSTKEVCVSKKCKEAHISEGVINKIIITILL
jgi:hypothetical protein